MHSCTHPNVHYLKVLLAMNIKMFGLQLENILTFNDYNDCSDMYSSSETQRQIAGLRESQNESEKCV